MRAVMSIAASRLPFHSQNVTRVQVRTFIPGVVRTVGGLLFRRLILYPSLLVGGGSLAIDEMKSRVDLPELGNLGKYSGEAAGVTRDMLARIQNAVLKAGEVVLPSVDVASKSMEDSLKDTPEKISKPIIQVSDAIFSVTQCEGQEDKETYVHDESQLTSDLVEELEKLQKELEHLSAENASLRRSLVIQENQAMGGKRRRAVELFGEIMQLRERADSAFKAQDHLPRIVVVGDQSAGKTSVLEVIARARIFPRGAGEMMTRAPVQVTLSEDVQRSAQFHDSERVYDLTSERELSDLRKEIERRMTKSVEPGHAISSQTIGLYVRGPGLRPMVLVDLPGLIQHHTLGMKDGTKEEIREICENHIKNPNAMILCVQDASRDAEGSSIADVVRSADPTGQRTVFVLTKVDMAEKLERPLKQLNQILNGQKFNMKARNYFAVVTGTRKKDDSIENIRLAEKKYFEESKLFRGGTIMPRTLGTDNLTKAISATFWDLVYNSMEKELRDTSMVVKRKEKEWKSRYPNEPWLPRSDLLRKGRQTILENVSSNSLSHSEEIESQLKKLLWDRLGSYIVDVLYTRAADSGDAEDFQINSNSLVETWVMNDLPQAAANLAKNAFLENFYAALDFPDPEGTFTNMKELVKRGCLEKLEWNKESLSMLQHVQELNLRDNYIPSKESWVGAANFMLEKLDQEAAKLTQAYKECRGPSFWSKWIYWQAETNENRLFKAVSNELAPYFPPGKPVRPNLESDDIQAVVHILDKRYGLKVSSDYINEVYRELHKLHFIDLGFKSAQFCKGQYSLFTTTGREQQDISAPNGLGCKDVAFFWRIQKMLSSTSNVLRLEADDYQKRIEDTLRDVVDDALEEGSHDLISGPRVDLAEEIEVVRLMHSRLTEFVKVVNEERKK
eukprot:m.194567 g.194567  ORF g.194567 m.194567 type:complete len:902 (+) comp15676_c0_seq2:91-2796(+)